MASHLSLVADGVLGLTIGRPEAKVEGVDKEDPVRQLSISEAKTEWQVLALDGREVVVV